MKKISNYLCIGVTAAALALAGCAKDAKNEPGGGEAEGALTVTLKGEFDGKKANALAVGTPGAGVENKVFSYTVYVFDYNTGIFEKAASSNSNMTTTISGLSTAGTKRVVVVANPCPGAPAFGTGDNYSKFAASAIDLTTQTPSLMATQGLLMSGESEGAVTLTAGSSTTVDVEVKRVVAKVQLGAITIANDAVGDFSKLTIKGVSVQRAIAKSTVGPTTIQQVGDVYYGGVRGGTSQAVQPFLRDSIGLPAGYVQGAKQSFSNYFYVFPDVDPNFITLLTVEAAYEGVSTPYYYPIEVNSKVNSVGNDGNADGTYIKRNYVYTVNLTLKNLVGMGDPDTPMEPANLSVTVTVSDWDGAIEQNTEF